MKKRILPLLCLVIISGLSVPAFAQPAVPGMNPDENQSVIQPLVSANNNTSATAANTRLNIQLLRKYNFRQQKTGIATAHLFKNHLQQSMWASSGGGGDLNGISAESLDKLSESYYPLQFPQPNREQ
jgi:hypothetical protein